MFSPASFGDVTTWYVSITGDDTNGGHTAGDALRTIDKAIEKAIADIEDEQEIIVLAGTYNEFDLFRYDIGADHIHIYSQDGPDVTVVNATGHSSAFWFGHGETSSIVIEGFEISGANSIAVRCIGASPTIRNCHIKNNGGYGVYLSEGSESLIDSCEISEHTIVGVNCLVASPTLQDCHIFDNARGVWFREGHLSMTGCDVESNSILDSGAGIYLPSDDASAAIEHCRIYDNVISGEVTDNDTYAGAGIYIDGADVTMSDCEIYGNVVDVQGATALYVPHSLGGGVYARDCTPTIDRCEIHDNTTSEAGGGIYCYDSQPTIDHCKIHHNTANAAGGGIYLTYSTTGTPLVPVISWSEVTCNQTLLIEEPNVILGEGGGLYIRQGDRLFPNITHSVIAENDAVSGGGIFTPSESSPSGPAVCYSDGGVNGQIILNNCLIVNNEATGNELHDDESQGGAIRAGAETQFKIINCTFSGNSSQWRGGGMYSENSCIESHNTISWGDGAYEGNELYVEAESRVYYSYTELQGGTAAVRPVDWEAQGSTVVHAPVINTLPYFQAVEDCDYRLLRISPLINFGDYTVVPPDEVDLDGMDREVPDDNVDLGCYEYQLATCPIATIQGSNPADGTVDAREPHPDDDNSQGALEGIGDLQNPIKANLYPPSDTATDLACWALCETGTHGYDPNEIVSVTLTSANTYEFELLRPIAPGEATRIIYRLDGSYVEFVSHPGNADAQGKADPFDITSLINYLNGVETPPAVPYSTDIDRSSVFDGFDVVTIVNLLNGADAYDEWNDSNMADGSVCNPSIPEWCGCTAGVGEICGGEMVSLPEGAPAVPPSLGDVFADYLADVDLTSEVQGEAYSSLVDAFCYWIVETESVAERQALACQLTDPEFTCVSEAVQEDLPAIAARIAE